MSLTHTASKKKATFQSLSHKAKMYKFFKTGLVLTSYLATVSAQAATTQAATPYADMASTYGDGEYDVTMNAAGCYVLTGTLLLVVICEDELGADEVVQVNGKLFCHSSLLASQSLLREERVLLWA